MDRAKSSYLQGFISIIVNTALFTLKMWAGIVTGSIALTADAWHTLSDSLSSIVVVIATKLSTRKPDKDHPFGHGRWEQISAIFIAFLLGIIAYDFMKDSIINLQEKKSTTYGTIAIVVTIISMVIKEGMAQYAFYIGRKTDNLSVKADGWHHRSDAISSVVVLVGIFFSTRFWWIDSVLGMIIALMLFYATYEIAKSAINKLLGETPDEVLIKKINDIVDANYHESVLPHHYHIHNYITHQELTFHIKLNNDLTLNDAHKIATNIEEKIKQQLGIIATVHFEPLDYEHSSD